MIATPASAAAIASQVRSGIGSRITTHASSAARNGEVAWNSSTCATLVCASARMKADDTVARHTATTSPARPTLRMAASVPRPRRATR